MTLHELFNMWRAGQVYPPALRVPDFPGRDGEWIPANRLLLSMEYGPTHHLDELEQRKLFDLHFTTGLAFLDPVLVSSSTNQDLPDWRDFLTGLGVDRELNDHPERFSQRIGVMCALRHERNRGRTPAELEESAKRGYDIESTSADGTMLYIEAKGSKDQKPDVRLTVNEFRALKIKGDSYHVYIARECMDLPRTLHSWRGEIDRPDIGVFCVDCRYAQWIQLKEGPVTFPNAE